MFLNTELDELKNSKPEELANEVLKRVFKEEIPSFPIDPFVILDKLNVIYQFKDFKDLEGIYIVPENEDDIAIIGININRPITRQRFTAAHELCHHLKDRMESSICPIDGRQKSPIEKFADRFASELLMPTEYLEKEVKKYEIDGYVSFDDVLNISDVFGVSFESCVFNIAYKLNKISGNIDSKQLKKRISKYKPTKKKEEKGLNTSDKKLMINIINSYKFVFDNKSDLIWYKFKNDFIYNENRIEGVKLSIGEVSEIVTDLRMKKQDSSYCNSEYKDIIEVLGHASVYDYVMTTQENITAFSLLTLHKKLYQYAPYPEEGGKIRSSNNYVTEAKFETADYKQIPIELLNLNDEIKSLISKKDEYCISEYIDRAIKIHYKITVMHPFHDGNGRMSRVLLNWLLRIKKLPPVYLKYKDKELYYEALQKADVEKNFEFLGVIFYKQILLSIIQLNSSIV